MQGEKLRGHLEAIVLSALSSGPAHGYLVITRIAQRSEGAFDLAEGTVYPVLHRLERAGRIASTTSEVDGRRRRVYALTEEGRRVLAHEREQWRRFSSLVTHMIGAPA